MKKIVNNIFVILDSREKKQFISLALLDVLISMLDISFLALLLYVINFYTGRSQPGFLLGFSLFNRYPLSLISLFFILFSLKNLLGFYIFKAECRFVYAVASRLSGKNLGDYLSGSYIDYVNVDSSIHVRKIGQEPIEFAHYVLRGIQQMMSQAILILITVVAVLLFNPVLFLLLFLILVPPIVLIGFFMKKKLNTARKLTKVTSAKALQHLQESIASFIECNTYHKKDFFINRYQHLQTKLNRLLADQQIIQNMPSRVIEVFAVFGLFVLIGINSFTEGAGTINVLVIGAFMAAAYKIIPGIVKILNSAGQVKTYGFTITDLLQKHADEQAPGEVISDKITSIKLANVSFAYEEENVLRDLSLEIKMGDIVAISGLSGTGKTTILNLLMGFLEPRSGHVIINGTVVNNVTHRQFRDRISYSKQQPFFIHDTLAKNVTLEEYTCNTRRLDGILTAAGIADLHQCGSEESSMMITENGKNFSGGQRQRIALARALYKDFDLIILDEPFSELDELAESKLLNDLRNISAEGKLVLLVTHSKAALSFCNKIIYLDD